MSVIRIMVLVAVAGCASAEVCPADERLPEHAVVIVGSSVNGDGALTPGRRVRCAGAEVRAVWAALDEARAAMPAGIGPEQIEVHFDPRVRAAAPVDRIEVHEQSGALLVASGADLDVTVLLHELAHVRMRGARPADRMAARLVRSVEEGVADWVAASVAGSPRVGGDGGRDLSQPPGSSTSAWVALALPHVRVDPHELGRQLAARLWRAEPTGGTLRADLIAALADGRVWPDGTGPSMTAEQIVARCPARSRARAAELLHDWIPLELARARVPGGTR